MNLSKNTKRYEDLSTRANNVLLNYKFTGGKDDLRAILSGMPLYEFVRRYRNGGKVTYSELRKWCGLGDDYSKDPPVTRTGLSFTDMTIKAGLAFADMTLMELLRTYRKSDDWDLDSIRAEMEIIRRFDAMQSRVANATGHPEETINLVERKNMKNRQPSQNRPPDDVIHSIFDKHPLSLNLLLLAKGEALLSVWMNEFILQHYSSHDALIRIIDKDKSLQKLTDILGGKYVSLPSSIGYLPENQLLAFDPAGNSRAKMEAVDAIARELRSETERIKIIVFWDLLDFVSGGEPDLLEAVTGICRDARDCNGAVLTVFRSYDELDYLGKLGVDLMKHFGAVICLRWSAEDFENFQQRGFFTVGEPA